MEYQEYNFNNQQVNSQPQSQNKYLATVIAKVFLWMFYAILLTGAVSYGLPYLLVALGWENAYLGFIIGGLIATFILSFVGTRVIANTRSTPLAILVFSLFAIAMGTWISPILISYDISTAAISFGVTSVIFLIMGTYGLITKRDLTGFATFLIMILFGAVIVSIVNIFIANTMLDWIISYVILAVYIGFIAYDIQRVKKMALDNTINTNYALIMALNLYLDFAYIFIRLLSIVGGRKN